MALQSQDTSINPDNKQQYRRRIFWCKTDDVWIQIEEPVDISSGQTEWQSQK